MTFANIMIGSLFFQNLNNSEPLSIDACTMLQNQTIMLLKNMIMVPLPLGSNYVLTVLKPGLTV